MSHPIINSDECSACGICIDACEQDVLDIVGSSAAVVNEESCTACGECMEECPMGAIEDIEED